MWLTSLRAHPCHSPWNTKKATKMFDYTAIADRLRTVSWRTGMVNRFTGRPLPFPVKQKDGQKMFDYTAIADRLRTVSWRTDVVNRFTGPTLPFPVKQKDGQKMFDYTAIADRLRTVSLRTDVVNRFTGPTLPVKSKGHKRNQTNKKGGPNIHQRGNDNSRNRSIHQSVKYKRTDALSLCHQQ